MFDSAITHLLKSIAENQPARISLTTTASETFHLDCIYKEGLVPSRFFLVFPPKRLPKEIDLSQHCLVSIHNADEDTTPLSLNAKIEDVIGDRTLELTAKRNIDPTTLREFFRVALYAPVTIGSAPGSYEDRSRQWSLKGETLDISGSGLLALFDAECQDRQHITITLELPSPQASVSCIGHVIYTRRARKGRWQIALHFDEIATKQRDLIISNCLFEQRRQLKMGLQPNI
jgi:hypothetical protein